MKKWHFVSKNGISDMHGTLWFEYWNPTLIWDFRDTKIENGILIIGTHFSIGKWYIEIMGHRCLFIVWLSWFISHFIHLPLITTNLLSTILDWLINPCLQIILVKNNFPWHKFSSFFYLPSIALSSSSAILLADIQLLLCLAVNHWFDIPNPTSQRFGEKKAVSILKTLVFRG